MVGPFACPEATMRLDVPRLKHEARYLLCGWCVLVSVVGTIGGVIGCVELHRESTRS